MAANIVESEAVHVPLYWYFIPFVTAVIHAHWNRIPGGHVKILRETLATNI